MKIHTTPQRDEAGFGSIGILVLIAAIGIVGFVGWQIKSRLHATTASSSPQKIITAISPAGPDPTSGWQTQCLTDYSLCLKHPADWVASLSTSTSYALTSPDGAAEVMVNAAPHTTAPTYYHQSYYLTTNSHVFAPKSVYTVLGGYTAGAVNNSAAYFVAPASYTGHSLQTGTTVDLSVPAIFSYMHGGTQIDGRLQEIPMKDFPLHPSASQSLSWLNSPTAQTGMAILKSVTTN